VKLTRPHRQGVSCARVPRVALKRPDDATVAAASQTEADAIRASLAQGVRPKLKRYNPGEAVRNGPRGVARRRVRNRERHNVREAACSRGVVCGRVPCPAGTEVGGHGQHYPVHPWVELRLPVRRKHARVRRRRSALDRCRKPTPRGARREAARQHLQARRARLAEK
jgi:hypothetical protein